MIAHLINTDVGGRGILRLYLDYRRENFNFLHNSATMLLNNFKRVLIVTGFPIPPADIPETDGPPGALAVALAVEKLGGRADILTYPEIRGALTEFWDSFVERPRISEYSLVIAIETPGKSSDGMHYSMSGLEIKREALDGVVLEARRRGIPTIGIGDGGNEAGMGKVRELVVRYIPQGEKIASVVETDELITSAVSNWGAYGLVAEASMLTGENLLGDFDEVGIVKALAEAGIIDGVTKRADVSVDGIDMEVHSMIMKFLKAIVEQRVKDKLKLEL
ncbi:glutamate cyclase domain-containing protein [Thermococcus sp.]|uniref:glutamate cyclase domain-containing protein n=1 Tax=Thermococcus sp. TaxID=35749 RepID=UPI00261067E9|nr:glutamate cyclase domain-containing protein [Thermococcus sp.]